MRATRGGRLVIEFSRHAEVGWPRQDGTSDLLCAGDFSRFQMQKLKGSFYFSWQCCGVCTVYFQVPCPNLH
ncbi:hypothetical protein GN956_G14394 [Arapaima gigas]